MGRAGTSARPLGSSPVYEVRLPFDSRRQSNGRSELDLWINFVVLRVPLGGSLLLSLSL